MNCPVLNLFQKCSCLGGMICSFCGQVAIAVMAIVFGALVAWKPRKVIEIQMALYRPFNWKIEPISMKKEIRNMRIMGIVVLVLGILALGFILWS